jgi:two-component system LytT family response regulator
MNNSRIRVLIVDDEPIARRGIRHLLAAHDDFEITGEARNGKEALRLIGILSPDLIFLDVQMPEIDGFDLLRLIPPERLPAVIFVTAHDAFAVRAFEAHALDYLVKPINEARFRDALTRARDRLRSHEALELSRRLSMLLSNGNDLGPARQPRVDPPRRLVIGAMGSDLIVDVAQISWIEADDYYAAVHAAGRRHLVRESLASLEARLDPFQFVRTHRAAIANLSHVREIKSDASGESSLVLSDGTLLPLSRRRRRKVEAAMRRFAG